MTPLRGSILHAETQNLLDLKKRPPLIVVLAKSYLKGSPPLRPAGQPGWEILVHRSSPKNKFL